MGYYNGRADFEGNLRYIMNNQTNLAVVAGHTNQAATAGFIASQGDINIVLREIAALKTKLDEKTNETDYVKASDNATVYYFNRHDGTLRGLTLKEFNMVMALGHRVATVSPAVVSALLPPAPEGGAA